MEHKLLAACHGIEECHRARQKVSNTLQSVKDDPYSSISPYEETHPSKKDADTNAFLTERERRGTQGKWNNQKMIRYACGKTGCHSKNHPFKESIARLRKTKKYKDRHQVLVTELLDEEHQLEIDGRNVPNTQAAWVSQLLEEEERESADSDSDNVPEPHANFTVAQDLFTSTLQDSATVHAITKKVW